VVMHVEPKGSGAITGSFIHGFEMDVGDDMPSGQQGIQRLMIQEGKVCPWTSGGIAAHSRVNRTKFAKNYFCHDVPNASSATDLRLTTKGYYYLLTNEKAYTYGSGGSSGTQVALDVNIYATYDIRFKNATLELSTAPASVGAFSAFEYSTVGGVVTNQTISQPLALGFTNFSLVSVAAANGSYRNAPNLIVGKSSGNGRDCIVLPTGSQADYLLSAVIAAATTQSAGGTGFAANALVGAVVTSFNPYVANNTSLQFTLCSLATTQANVTLSAAWLQDSTGNWGSIGTVTTPCWLALEVYQSGSPTYTGAAMAVLPGAAYTPTLYELDPRLGPATEEWQAWQDAKEGETIPQAPERWRSDRAASAQGNVLVALQELLSTKMLDASATKSARPPRLLHIGHSDDEADFVEAHETKREKATPQPRAASKK
jgi:hypothetical protein